MRGARGWPPPWRPGRSRRVALPGPKGRQPKSWQPSSNASRRRRLASRSGGRRWRRRRRRWRPGARRPPRPSASGPRPRSPRQRAAAAAAQDAATGAEAAAGDLAAAVAVRAAAEERAASLGAERDRLRAALAQADAALSNDDQAEREARAQLAALRDERGALEVAVVERRVALEHLAAELKERYDLGPEALAAVAVDEGDAAARAARIEELRRRLAALGDVNPAAMQELEEVEARHSFLTAQRDDLERSLDDLRRTIAKLTRTSRARFEETFAAANAKLGEVFPKLFPGGTARLELTDAEEDGEPGVEIAVQPAGKQLRRLSLLSGGEK